MYCFTQKCKYVFIVICNCVMVTLKGMKWKEIVDVGRHCRRAKQSKASSNGCQGRLACGAGAGGGPVCAGGAAAGARGQRRVCAAEARAGRASIGSRAASAIVQVRRVAPRQPVAC